MKAVLVFVDGVICDYRQRLHLSGTPDYPKREMIMKDAPTPDSVRCLLELSQRYKLVYMTARPETAKAATEEWLNAMNFPKGPLFVGPKQPDRLVLAAALREEFEFEAGLGARWEDNALHLELGCESIILKEFECRLGDRAEASAGAGAQRAAPGYGAAGAARPAAGRRTTSSTRPLFNCGMSGPGKPSPSRTITPSTFRPKTWCS